MIQKNAGMNGYKNKSGKTSGQAFPRYVNLQPWLTGTRQATVQRLCRSCPRRCVLIPTTHIREPVSLNIDQF